MRFGAAEGGRARPVRHFISKIWSISERRQAGKQSMQAGGRESVVYGGGRPGQKRALREKGGIARGEKGYPDGGCAVGGAGYPESGESRARAGPRVGGGTSSRGSVPWRQRAGERGEVAVENGAEANSARVARACLRQGAGKHDLGGLFEM